MYDFPHYIPLQQYADDIKTQFGIPWMSVHPDFSGLFQEPLLTCMHGLFRKSETEMAAGFYFHKDDDIILQGDTIHLLPAAPPVLVQDRITKFF